MRTRGRTREDRIDTQRFSFSQKPLAYSNYSMSDNC
jgi:hypothetical protein